MEPSAIFGDIRQIFVTILTDDVTSEIAENDWERRCVVIDDDLKGDDRFGSMRKPKFAFHLIASEDGERRLLLLLLSL